MQDNVTGRAETQVPARGKDIEAIRSPEYSQTYWHLCSKATDHDRDGTSAW